MLPGPPLEAAIPLDYYYCYFPPHPYFVVDLAVAQHFVALATMIRAHFGCRPFCIPPQCQIGLHSRHGLAKQIVHICPKMIVHLFPQQ
jgi:hypothetical protein